MDEKEQGAISGVALAAFAMAGSVIFVLKQKGLLNGQEIVNLIDSITLQLEQHGLSDEAKKIAHELLEQLIRQLAPPPSSPLYQ